MEHGDEDVVTSVQGISHNGNPPQTPWTPSSGVPSSGVGQCVCPIYPPASSPCLFLTAFCLCAISIIVIFIIKILPSLLVIFQTYIKQNLSRVSYHLIYPVHGKAPAVPRQCDYRRYRLPLATHCASDVFASRWHCLNRMQHRRTVRATAGLF